MEEVLGTETLQKYMSVQLFPVDDDVQMYEYKSVTFPTRVCKYTNLQAMEKWQARSEDIFVISYPKAGTTWIQEVVSGLVNKGDLEKLNKSHTFFRVPFIEATFFDIPGVPPTHEIVNKMKSPRTIKSHLPGHILPPDVFQKKAKIVYIARNPKDLCVSYYYFHVMNPTLPKPESWNAFFDDFYSGKITFGPWWDHYLFYWHLRHEPNVLFLNFEDMKRDLKKVVLRTAKFLCYTFSDNIIDQIVDHCSFESMRKNPMSNPDTLFKLARQQMEANRKDQNASTETTENQDRNVPFMRKGKVGDWRNHFTVAQNEAFEAQIQEKLAGSGLTFNY